MNKKKIIIVAVTLIAIICIIGGLFLFKNKNKTTDLSKVVATSKIGNITIGDIQNYLNSLQPIFGQQIDANSLKPEELTLMVNEVVNDRILLKKAKDDGIENTDEYKERMNVFANSLAKELFLQKLIADSVTDEAIKKRYDEVNEMLKDKKEYKVKHILVKTKPEIEKVVAELKNHTFEDLAEKYSIDSSKSNGGDLGYVVEGQTVKEFDDVLKKQPLNKLSEPFETQFGWHVLIKEDERKATIQDFDSQKEIIKDTLTKEAIRNFSLQNLEEMDIKMLNN